MTLNSVVLPAPFGPMTPRISLAPNCRLMSCSARSPPKLIPTPSTLSSGSDAAVARGSSQGGLAVKSVPPTWPRNPPGSSTDTAERVAPARARSNDPKLFCSTPTTPFGRKISRTSSRRPVRKNLYSAAPRSSSASTPRRRAQRSRHRPAGSRPRQRADAPQNSHRDIKNGDGKNECIGIDELGEPREQPAGNSGIECPDGERDGLVMGDIDAHSPRCQFILPNGDKRPSVP